MLRRFRIQRMPFCCGVDAVLVAGMATTVCGLADDIKQFIRHGCDDGSGKVGLLLWTLADYQLKTMRPVLEGCGFSEMIGFKNPKTRHKVRLFGRLVNQPEPKLRRRPKALPKEIRARLK